VTPNGRFVYVSNAGSSTISGFSIGVTGALTPVGATIVGINPTGSVNLDLAVTADGKFLYSLNSGSGTIGTFAIQENGTLLNEGEISAITANAGFNGIASF
jgi:6-phosphogluconolactonase